MAIDITGPVSSLVRTALDASALRHQAISNNIANINTPGYKSVKVSFEDQLQSLLSGDAYKNDAVLKQQIKNTKPYIYQSNTEQQTGNIDTEMVEMAKNTIHYQVLLKASRGYGAMMKMAIKEGKS